MKITAKNYEVGKSYKYNEIPQENTDEYTVNDYGDNYIGENAIHVKFTNTNIDVWFVLDGYAIESIYKCVYNN